MPLTASLFPYTITDVVGEYNDLIATPLVSPLAISLIGTSLLGEVILIVAVTFSGTISTSTTLPFQEQFLYQVYFLHYRMR